MAPYPSWLPKTPKYQSGWDKALAAGKDSATIESILKPRIIEQYNQAIQKYEPAKVAATMGIDPTALGIEPPSLTLPERAPTFAEASGQALFPEPVIAPPATLAVEPPRPAERPVEKEPERVLPAEPQDFEALSTEVKLPEFTPAEAATTVTPGTLLSAENLDRMKEIEAQEATPTPKGPVISSLNAGSARLLSNTAKIPGLALDILTMGGNVLNTGLNKVFGTKLATDMGTGKMAPVLYNNMVTKFMDNIAEQDSYVQQEFRAKGEDMISLFRKGRVADLGKYLAWSTLEQMPQLAAILAGQLGGVPAMGTIGVLGAGAGAEQMDQWWEQAEAGEDVPPQYLALMASVVNGTAEAAFERMGSYRVLEPLADALRRITRKHGADAAKKYMGGAIKEFFGGILAGGSQEMKEEFGTAVAQGIVDKTTKMRPGLTWTDIMKDALESGVIGFTSGGVPGAAGGVAQQRLRRREELINKLRQIKPMEAEVAPTPEPAAPEAVPPPAEPAPEAEIGIEAGIQTLEQAGVTKESFDGLEPDERDRVWESLNDEARDALVEPTEEDKAPARQEDQVEPPTVYRPQTQESRDKGRVTLESLAGEAKANDLTLTDDQATESAIFAGRHTVSRLPSHPHHNSELNAIRTNPKEGHVLLQYALDFNYFKNIDDTYGHAVGDKVMVGIQRYLSNKVEELGGNHYHFGGDEGGGILYVPKAKVKNILQGLVQMKKDVNRDQKIEGPETGGALPIGLSIAVKEGFDFDQADQLLTDSKIEGKPAFIGRNGVKFDKALIKEYNIKDATGEDYGPLYTRERLLATRREVPSAKKVPPLHERRPVVDDGRVAQEKRAAPKVPGRRAEPPPAAAPPAGIPKEAAPEPAVEKPLAKPERVDLAEKSPTAKDIETEPTEAQKEAENYRVAPAKFAGVELSIENPEGTTRKGPVDPKTGKPAWQTKMKAHYGRILGTVGFDKDHVDAFVKPRGDEAASIFVVNQVNPQTRKFDEHKIMMGYATAEEAQTAYLDHYESGWRGLKTIVEMSQEGFKDWAWDKTKRGPAGAELTPGKVLMIEKQVAPKKPVPPKEPVPPKKPIPQKKPAPPPPVPEGPTTAQAEVEQAVEDSNDAISKARERGTIWALSPNDFVEKHGADKRKAFLTAVDWAFRTGKIHPKTRHATDIFAYSADMANKYAFKDYEVNIGDELSPEESKALEGFKYSDGRHVGQAPKVKSKTVPKREARIKLPAKVDVDLKLGDGSIWFTFSRFPGRQVTRELKSMGFTWNSDVKAWVQVYKGPENFNKVQGLFGTNIRDTFAANWQEATTNKPTPEPKPDIPRVVQVQKPETQNEKEATVEAEGNQENTEYRRINNDFYIFKKDPQEFKQVQGRVVDIKPTSEFFTYKDDAGNYSVTEAITGTMISYEDTEEKAIKEAKRQLDYAEERGIDFKERIRAHITKFGHSPRYATTQTVPPEKQPKQQLTRYHRMYRSLKSIVPGIEDMPVGESKRLRAKGFMDLVVEHLHTDRWSLSHYYEQNGDLVSDPDMEVRINKKDGVVEAIHFQQGDFYAATYPAEGKVNPKAKKDNNAFLDFWLSNIKKQGHRELSPQESQEFAKSEGKKYINNSSNRGITDANRNLVQESPKPLETTPAPDVPAVVREGDTGVVSDENGETGAEGLPTDESRRSKLPRSNGVSEPGDTSARGTTGRTSRPVGVKRQDRTDDLSNYHITADDRIGVGTLKQKYSDNITAIRILKLIESQNRRATPEEQRILVRYVGWGWAAKVFDPKRNKGWEKEYQELKDLLTEKEYAAARASTINAHYTSPEIVQAIWTVVGRFGFTGGRCLEPGCGVGHFMGLSPENIKSGFTGIELDDLTGRIAGQLYQGHEIKIQGFQDYLIPKHNYNLAIGNVPFADVAIFDKNAKTYWGEKTRPLLHDFFFLKSLYGVRPGGVVAFITSKGTMDKSEAAGIRDKIAEKANFIGAVRMPRDAFLHNAGTQVVTDIVFLQVREPGTLPDDMTKKFLKTGTIQAAHPRTQQTYTFGINQYFIDNPEMVVGEPEAGGLYREDEYTVSYKGDNFMRDLYAALEELPRNIMKHVQANEKDLTEALTKPTVEDHVDTEELERVDELSHFIAKTGDIYQKVNGRAEKIEGLETVTEGMLKQNPKWVKQGISIGDISPEGLKGKKIRGVDKYLSRMRGMVRLRDSFYKLNKAELTENIDQATLGRLRKTMNREYNSFVKKWGPLHALTNTNVFNEDPGHGAILALEKWDRQKKKASKADVFEKRVSKPYSRATSAENSQDALMIVLSEDGRIDWDRMAELTGQTQEVLQKDLLAQALVFEDPALSQNGNRFVLSDEYLSGNVRTKLSQARQAIARDTKFTRNVEALEQVQPKDLKPSEITLKINSIILEENDIRTFIAELLTANPDHINIKRIGLEGRLIIEPEGYEGKWELKENPKNTTTYGTNRMNGIRIIWNLANNKDIKVYDTVVEDGQEKRVLNQEETDKAVAKSVEIVDQFKKWLWRDQARAERLVAKYNQEYNNIVNRKYEAPRQMKLPGLQTGITLRPHQSNAIWRVVQTIKNSNTMLAHVVGSGKTLEIIGSVMEARRLGLKNKPMIIIPNHMAEQWKADFQWAYPGAKVLVSTDKFMTPKRRQEFMNRVRTGNWDAVIMPFKHFQRIGVSKDLEVEYQSTVLNEYRQLYEDMAEARGKRDAQTKKIEKKLAKLEQRLKALQDLPKEPGLVWEDLGVDMLNVDEADEFKNLFFTTQRTSVCGMGNTAGAKKTMDLLMKIWDIQRKNHAGGMVFATGTPISNSLAEAYHMIRYLQPAVLNAHGMKTFDQWADMFAEVTYREELTPSGNGYKTRARFTKFVNVPELMNIMRESWDIQTREDLEEAKILRRGFELPKIKGDGPQDLVAPEYPMLTDYKEHLGEREEKAKEALKATGGKLLPGMDNALWIMNDGRKAAVDIRLVHPNLKQPETGKIAILVEGVYKTYQETNEKRGTQLIFFNLMKPDNGYPFSVQKEIKKRLIEKGVNPDEIAFIHDARTDIQKQDLFDRVNSGDIRVIIGNVQKMGAGTNIQERIKAVWWMDPPWRPRDIEQGNGRADRQGNIAYDEIDIHYLVQRGSIDQFSWQTLLTKARLIQQIMRGQDTNTREFEDDTGGFETMMIASIDNPAMLRGAEIQRELRELENQAKAFDEQVIEDRHTVATADKKISEFEAEIANVKEIITRRGPEKPKEFKAVIEGVTYNKPGEAGSALLAIRERSRAAGKVVRVHAGTYLGLKIEVKRGLIADFVYINGTFQYPMSESPIGTMQSIMGGIFKNPESQISYLERQIKLVNQDRAAAEERLKTPEFKGETRIKELRGELVKVRAEIDRIIEERRKQRAARVESDIDWLALENEARKMKGTQAGDEVADSGESTDRGTETPPEHFAIAPVVGFDMDWPMPGTTARIFDEWLKQMDRMNPGLRQRIHLHVGKEIKGHRFAGNEAASIYMDAQGVGHVVINPNIEQEEARAAIIEETIGHFGVWSVFEQDPRTRNVLRKLYESDLDSEITKDVQAKYSEHYNRIKSEYGEDTAEEMLFNEWVAKRMVRMVQKIDAAEAKFQDVQGQLFKPPGRESDLGRIARILKAWDTFEHRLWLTIKQAVKSLLTRLGIIRTTEAKSEEVLINVLRAIEKGNYEFSTIKMMQWYRMVGNKALRAIVLPNQPKGRYDFPHFSARLSGFDQPKSFDKDLETISNEADKEDPAEIPKETRGPKPVFDSVEVEARWQASKGITKKTLARRLAELKESIRELPRHFPKLDPARFAQVADILRQYEAVPSYSKVAAANVLKGVTANMNEEQYDGFTRLLVLPDILKDVDRGLYDTEDPETGETILRNLPFGFKTRNQIESAIAKMNEYANANPIVKRAEEVRNRFMHNLKRELVYHNLLPEKVMEYDAYFHHQVLQALELIDFKGVGVSAHDAHLRKKGFQKKRKGSSRDFNTEYVESEFEVLAQAIAQLENVRTLKKIKWTEDISHKLKVQAKQLNLEALAKKYAGQFDSKGRPVDPLRPFKQKIAFSSRQLGKMASDGMYDSDEFTKFRDIIANMAAEYELHERGIDTAPDGTDNSAFFKFLSHLVDNKLEGHLQSATIFKAIRDRQNTIQAELGKRFKTWDMLIPEGYTTWQPEKGNHFYQVLAVSDRVVQNVIEGDGNLERKDVRRAIAMGQKYREWVIPEPVAWTLDHFGVQREEILLEQISRYTLNTWKQWVLINPLRVVKYNINNMSGDLDITMAYDPKILTYAIRAARDLKGYSLLGRKASADILDLIRRGVIDSGMSLYEIPEISETGFFQLLTARNPNTIQKIWGKTGGLVWSGSRAFTNWRENILRLAAYRYFKDQLKAGERKIYGASKKIEIDQIQGRDDKAAKLARELIGDYGNISHAGQWLRQHMIPFYSWMEINTPRYYRLMKNLPEEGRSIKGAGKVLTYHTAKNIGKLAVKASFIYVMVNLWNKVRYPDEEEELGEQRRQLHLILGRRSDGTIRTLRFQGALSDALSWAGMEDLPADVMDLVNERMTFVEKLEDAGKAPVSKLANSLHPFGKAAAEVVTGYSIYPDMFKPRPIRDKVEHLTRMWSGERFYKALKRRPSRGFVDNLEAVIFYNNDPGEAAYWDSRKLVYQFLDREGEERPAGKPTSKGNALYYYKQALRFGDEPAAQRYYKQYAEMGGTRPGMENSIKRASPLAPIPTRFRSKFLRTLNEKDRKQLEKAYRWYKDIFLRRSKIENLYD